MYMRLFVVCSLVLIASSLQAAGLKLQYLTIGTVTYSNLTVLGANSTDLYFAHDQGFANVKLKYLPPEWQKRFNFDPKAAAEAEKKQAAMDALFKQGVAAKMEAAAQAEQKARTAREARHTSEQSLADAISDESPLGRVAPALKVNKWLTDQPALDGKFVLVSFWTPWSIPCRKAIPELNALQKKFAGRLVVMGVGLGSEAEISEMADPKIEFASALDADGKLCAAAGVTSVPSVLLLDPRRVVLFQGHPSALNEKQLEALLNKSVE
jgi:thiol-disulfide isomerase/thioredoxin